MVSSGVMFSPYVPMELLKRRQECQFLASFITTIIKKNIKNVTSCRDSRSAKSIETR